MVDALKVVAGTPLPTILVVAGLVFLLLAIADKVHGQISVSEQRKKHAFAIGVALLASGLSFKFLTTEPGGVVPRDDIVFEPAKFDPLARPGFDCGRYRKLPRDHAERLPQTDLFCIYYDLASADRQMGDQYRVYLEIAASSAKADAREDQRQWLKQRRSDCPVTWEDFANPGILRQRAECLISRTKERLEFYRTEIARIESQAERS